MALFAYIDPGSGGLLVQLLLGGLAGVLAYVRFNWARVRRRFGREPDAGPTE